jgi:hypothetical protein
MIAGTLQSAATSVVRGAGELADFVVVIALME